MADKKKKENSKEILASNVYVPELVKIEKIFTETEDTKRFRLKYTKPYNPGQFVQVGITGIGEAPISICSYSEECLEICVRNVGNLTNALFKLKEGDSVGIRGPFGNGFPMDSFEEKKIIVIGGGTGVAPLRGVLRYLEKNKKSFSSVEVLLGYRSPSEVLFKKDNEKWQKYFNFKITVDNSDSKWNGNTGLITELIKKQRINPENAVVITCGPPIMIKFVMLELESLGFDENNIWVSLERMMKCGLGKCGHCQVNSKYVCKDGPVFNYSEARKLEE